MLCRVCVWLTVSICWLFCLFVFNVCFFSSVRCCFAVASICVVFCLFECRKCVSMCAAYACVFFHVLFLFA